MYLSDPRNKSGLQTYLEYPKIKMLEESTVEFDGTEILGGAYDSSIQFKINPFEQDSLGNFDPLKIKLKGTFKTDIFPDLTQTLVVQEDYSLGFKDHHTPEEGLKVFQELHHVDDITFKGSISLNNQGITGGGQIDYITSNLKAQSFIYYQDSVLTQSGQGTIRALEDSDKYPDVTLSRFTMSWDVVNDKMKLTTQDTTFKIYDDVVDMEGVMIYSNENLIGSGKVISDDYEEQSRSFIFLKDTYESGGADLKIKSDTDKAAIIASNVNNEHDLPNQKITMRKAGVENSFRFPKIDYESSIEEAVWYRDSNKIEMVSKDNIATFVSNNPKEDSLTFEAWKATYDKNKKFLHIKIMKPIIVGNNHIIPNNKEVIIYEETGLEKLHNAEIYINKDNKYHHLSEAEIEIKSSHQFIGNAFYNFHKTNGQIVKIKFNSFDIKRTADLIAQTHSKDEIRKWKKLNQEFITEAEADISVDAPLDLFEGLNYYGKVFLKDYVKSLSLDGGISLEIDRTNNPSFAYKSESVQDYTSIFVDNTLKSLDNEQLLSGIYRTEDNDLFGSFIQTTDIQKPIPIFEGSGNLTFDSEYEIYKLLPNEDFRVKNDFVSDIINIGNSLSYDYVNQILRFSGNMKLLEANKHFEFVSIGIGKYLITQDKFSANCLFSFTLSGTSNLFKVFGTDFESKVAEDHNSKPKLKDDNFALKLAQLISPDKFKRLSRSIIQERRTIEIFKNQIIFSNLNLKWNVETRAFFNDGYINIANVLNKHIDNNVRGYIEIPKSENDYTINMFFINDDEEWYFMSLDKNKLSTLSSNPEYNTFAATNNSKELNLSIADYDEIVGYVDLFRRDYLDLEEPITLKEPEEIVISKKKNREEDQEPEVQETDDLFLEDEDDITEDKESTEDKETTSEEESLFEDLEEETEPTQKDKKKKPKKLKKETTSEEESLFEDLEEETEPTQKDKKKKPKKLKKETTSEEESLFEDLEEETEPTQKDKKKKPKKLKKETTSEEESLFEDLEEETEPTQKDKKKKPKKLKKETTSEEESLFKDLEEETEPTQKDKKKKPKKLKKETTSEEESLFEDLEEETKPTQKDKIPSRDKIIELLKRANMYESIEDSYNMTDEDLYALYKSQLEDGSKKKKKKKKK